VYWISGVLAIYGSFESMGAAAITALFVAYLALFPALFAVAMRRITMRFGGMALMTAPLVWVATELARTYLLTGFPWVLLGYSQASALPIAQLASLCGVYGVSALIVLVNAALAIVVIPATGKTGAPAGWFSRAVPLAASMLVVVVVAIWGAARMSASTLTREGEPIRVGMVQGNIDQSEKWAPARASAIFAGYLEMTERAISEGAQVVLWPEASATFFFEIDTASADRIRAIARRTQVPILVGSDQVEEGKPDRYFNAAFLVAPDGKTAGVYRKMHLVPFGEYVPLPWLFFFMQRLVVAAGDFSAGDTPTLFPLSGHRMSTAICYEVIYPDLVRGSVEAGSELLSTITNDAWFGRTSAPYQHFAQASMRAIENGRYLVRAANTGISGAVDPYGRTLSQSRIFEPAVVVSEVRFLQRPTFYTRYGDVLAYASAIVSLAMLVLAGRRVQ